MPRPMPVMVRIVVMTEAMTVLEHGCAAGASSSVDSSDGAGGVQKDAGPTMVMPSILMVVMVGAKNPFCEGEK